MRRGPLTWRPTCSTFPNDDSLRPHWVGNFAHCHQPSQFDANASPPFQRPAGNGSPQTTKHRMGGRESGFRGVWDGRGGGGGSAIGDTAVRRLQPPPFLTFAVVKALPPPRNPPLQFFCWVVVVVCVCVCVCACVHVCVCVCVCECVS